LGNGKKNHFDFNIGRMLLDVLNLIKQALAYIDQDFRRCSLGDCLDKLKIGHRVLSNIIFRQWAGQFGVAQWKRL